MIWQDMAGWHLIRIGGHIIRLPSQSLGGGRADVGCAQRFKQNNAVPLGTRNPNPYEV